MYISVTWKENIVDVNLYVEVCTLSSTQYYVGRTYNINNNMLEKIAKIILIFLSYVVYRCRALNRVYRCIFYSV